MRKLTKPEIDAAPDWAVEYFIDIKDIWYVNKKWGMAKMIGRVRNIKSHSSIISDAKPIPRKEFDINQCKYLKFKHLTIMSHPSFSSSMLTIGHNRFDAICLDKNQAIEIAKLLGATAEDLR